jgi:hypothetical protein
MPAAKTCVAFLTLASVLPTFPSQSRPSLAATQQSTAEGLRLLHKMQDGLGGAQSIGAIHDFEETIRAEAWDAAGRSLGGVRKRTRWMRTPNGLRLDQRGPRGTYVLYFDGGAASGWEILPDVTSPDLYKTTGKAIALTGGELNFARSYLSGFELNLWLADSMHGNIVTSPRPQVVRIEHDGNATDLTLDPVTSLPLKTAGVSLADPDHPVPAEMRYETWTDVSGIRFPTQRVNHLSGVKRGEATRDNATLTAERLFGLVHAERRLRGWRDHPFQSHVSNHVAVVLEGMRRVKGQDGESRHLNRHSRVDPARVELHDRCPTGISHRRVLFVAVRK